MKKRFTLILCSFLCLTFLCSVCTANSISMCAEYGEIVQNVYFMPVDHILSDFTITTSLGKCDVVVTAYCKNELLGVKKIPSVSLASGTVVSTDFQVPLKADCYKILFFNTLYDLKPIEKAYVASVPSAGLPDKISNALQRVDDSFKAIPVWLANLYDAKSGGFYMALSGKEDPNFAPGIEMTSWGISMLQLYTDCFASMPSAYRDKFIQFFNSRQNPDTRFFVDTQGAANDRETARNQSAAYTALRALGTEPLYGYPQAIEMMSVNEEQSSATSLSNLADSLPDYMDTLDTYIRWVSAWDWEESSWEAGDQVQQSLTYVNQLSAQQRSAYQDALYQWLDENQNPQTGLWSKNIDFNAVSGAFKVGLIYGANNKKVPMPDKILESITECFQTDICDSVYYIRNPLSLMNQLAGYSTVLRAKAQHAVIDNIDAITAQIQRFLCPDGAFSATYHKSMISFGGVTGSHGLFEGDIDATMMALIAGENLYSLFKIAPPKLSATNFFSWLSAPDTLPSPYQNTSLLETQYQPLQIDFEQNKTDSVINGTEFGGQSIRNDMTAGIVKDSDLIHGNVLKLFYDGKTDGNDGPMISLSNSTPDIRYLNLERTVTELDLKVENGGDGSNFYINFGAAPSCALSFYGSESIGIGARVSYMNTNYGGTLCSFQPGEWNRIKLIYSLSEDHCDAIIELYINNVLICTNNSYYGKSDGIDPVSMSKQLQLQYYKAGKGTVYLDNLKMYAESPYAQNFENQKGKIIGTEFGGNPIDSCLKAEVITDTQDADNQVLSLSYNAASTASGGPDILFADRQQNAFGNALFRNVAEFDIKVSDCTGQNNFFINFGDAPSYAISFSGIGTQAAYARVAYNAICYQDAIFSLEENVWYKLKFVYCLSDDQTSATIKIYINDTLVGESRNYNNVHIGNLPVPMTNALHLYYYKAGACNIFLDNIKLYTE